MERDRRPLLDRPMPRCFRIQHANSWSVLAVPCMVCWFPVPLRLCTEVETAVLTRFFCYTKIVGGGVKSHEAVMQLEFNATIVLTVPILRYLSSPLLLYCFSDGGGGERKRRRRRRMRKSCCHKEGLNRGAWTSQEDKLLSDYIMAHGLGRWRNLPANAGLNRCGKSCRLRWLNYLRPDIKRGNITKEEEELIIRLHKLLGNRWSLIAGRLPGRTDNEIKNYWNTHLRKRIPGGSSSSCSSDSSSEQTKDGSMKESADKEKKSQGSENVNVIRTKAVRCTRTMFVEQAFTDQLLGAADELGQYDVFADCRGVIRGADGLCPVEEAAAAAAAAAAIANQKSSRLLHEAEARSSIGLHDYCSTMANYADDYNYASICNGEAGEDSGEFFRFISNDAWESLLMSPRV